MADEDRGIKMAQDLDEMMQKAPTLTLDPFGEEKAAVAEKGEKPPGEPPLVKKKKRGKK